jgi:hypothetical protein
MLGIGPHTTDKNEIALQCPNIYTYTIWICCALKQKRSTTNKVVLEEADKEKDANVFLE